MIVQKDEMSFLNLLYEIPIKEAESLKAIPPTIHSYHHVFPGTTHNTIKSLHVVKTGFQYPSTLP
jgi:hypothetical protein